jgi:hypothetical protein
VVMLPSLLISQTLAYQTRTTIGGGGAAGARRGTRGHGGAYATGNQADGVVCLPATLGLIHLPVLPLKAGLRDIPCQTVATGKVWYAHLLHAEVETAQCPAFCGSPSGGQAAISTALSLASNETVPGDLSSAAAGLVLPQ